MKENNHITERVKRVAKQRIGRKPLASKNDQENNQQIKVNGKRSVSELSPAAKHPVLRKRAACGDITNVGGKHPVLRKRAACGDITNAIQAHSDRLKQARKKKEKTEKIIVSKRQTRTSNKKYTDIQSKEEEKKSSKIKTEIDLPDYTCELISSSNENQETFSTTAENCQDSVLSNRSLLSNTSLNTSIRPVPDLPEEIVKEYETPSKMTEKPKPTLVPYDTDQDPNLVSEYAESVFRNMKRREGNYPVSSYLNSSTCLINGSMRAILVDWLVEVQENFELFHETLYLAVRIVDNFLQKQSLSRDLLQLLGATALLIACKVEEHMPPPLDDFQFICDDAYTHKQFVQMELKILRTLEFDINLPISYRFLRRYARVTSQSMQTLTLSRYILELSLQDANFITTPPSKVAAACLCLALKMRDERDWDENFVYHTTYSEEDLRQLMADLNKMVEGAPKEKLQTIRTKYSHTIFFEVALTPAVDALLL